MVTKYSKICAQLLRELIKYITITDKFRTKPRIELYLHSINRDHDYSRIEMHDFLCYASLV